MSMFADLTTVRPGVKSLSLSWSRRRFAVRVSLSMRVVMFITGIPCVVIGLLLLLLYEDKDGKRTKGTVALLSGVLLLILGSGLGDRVQRLKLGEAGMEMAFAPEPAVLTPQQVAGAQKAQAQKLTLATPQHTTASLDWTPSQTFGFEAAIRRRWEETAALHQALANQGFAPTTDPSVIFYPGTVVRLSPDGKISLQFSWHDAFPDLKMTTTTFDFVQFTSLGGTKPGFADIGFFHCQQGFREDMDLASEFFIPISANVDNAMRQDPTLHVVKSVLGCNGNFNILLTQDQKLTPVQQVLGFQLGTPVRR